MTPRLPVAFGRTADKAPQRRRSLASGAEHGIGGSDAPAAPPRVESDDYVLVREIALGDARALDQLIARYWRPLTLYASRILDDVALAEDTVQTTFIRLWEDRSGPRPASVRRYLFRVTRNLALDELRSRSARRRREQRASADDTRREPTPEQVLEEDTLAETMDRAIQRLPVRRREAFTLAYVQHLSYAEIAEIMGVSLKTVGHHVSAALSELREQLSPLVREQAPPPC